MRVVHHRCDEEKKGEKDVNDRQDEPGTLDLDVAH